MKSLDGLVSLKEATRLYPGTKPHISTVVRHALYGVSGVRLQSWRVGGRRMTSRAAIEQFVATLSEPSKKTSRPTTESNEVDQQLDHLGI